MKLFQYAIFWLPNEQQTKDGQKAKILVPINTVLAPDVNAANILASRAIPKEYESELDQVQLCVRPF